MFNFFKRKIRIERDTIFRNGTVYHKQKPFDGEGYVYVEEQKKTIKVRCFNGKKIGFWAEKKDKYVSLNKRFLFTVPNWDLTKFWDSFFPKSNSLIKINISPDPEFTNRYGIYGLNTGCELSPRSPFEKEFDKPTSMTFFGEYVDGAKKGVWYSLFKNGNKFCEIEYEKNKRNGKAFWYYISGKIRCKGTFIDDEMNGDWIWYYDDGEIEKKLRFKRGKFIRSRQFFDLDIERNSNYF